MTCTCTEDLARANELIAALRQAVDEQTQRFIQVQEKVVDLRKLAEQRQKDFADMKNEVDRQIRLAMDAHNSLIEVRKLNAELYDAQRAAVNAEWLATQSEARAWFICGAALLALVTALACIIGTA